MSNKRNDVDTVSVTNKAIGQEDYLREHAERLRAYARYTSPKAAVRLMESAQILEWEAKSLADLRSGGGNRFRGTLSRQ